MTRLVKPIVFIRKKPSQREGPLTVPTWRRCKSNEWMEHCNVLQWVEDLKEADPDSEVVLHSCEYKETGA